MAVLDASGAHDAPLFGTNRQTHSRLSALNDQFRSDHYGKFPSFRRLQYDQTATALGDKTDGTTNKGIDRTLAGTRD